MNDCDFGKQKSNEGCNNKNSFARQPNASLGPANLRFAPVCGRGELSVAGHEESNSVKTKYAEHYKDN